jgi:glycosyltransferase involved in cell wall biosynthesis
MKLSIFFPCHNEAENIGLLLEKVSAFAGKYLEDYEILVVDDGSKDDTRAIAENFSKTQDHKVRVIHHPVSRKYGGALQSGFKNAQFPFIFYTDGDGQFDIFELKDHLSKINDQTVLSGYRHKRHDSPLRLINAAIFNFCAGLVFGLWVKDKDGAFKVYPKAIVDRMQLFSVGAMIDAEMLCKAKYLGCKIEQFPVTHLPRLHGVASGAKLSVIFKAMQEFVLLWRHLQTWKKTL